MFNPQRKTKVSDIYMAEKSYQLHLQKMADITREPWNDPAKNSIAAVPSRMEGSSVKPVILVGPDGETYAAGNSGGGGGSDKGANASVTNVASSATSVTVVAANANRVEALIENSSTEVMYVKYGATASVTDYTKQLNPGDAIVIDTYTGIVDAIWDAAGGDVRVTEVTP